MTHNLYAADNTVAVKFCAFDYIGTGLVCKRRNRDDVVGMEFGNLRSEPLLRNEDMLEDNEFEWRNLEVSSCDSKKVTVQVCKMTFE